MGSLVLAGPTHRKAEKTPPAPQRAPSLSKSHSHHQHNFSAMGVALGTCFHPPGTLLSVQEHLCAKVALKCSCVKEEEVAFAAIAM